MLVPEQVRAEDLVWWHLSPSPLVQEVLVLHALDLVLALQGPNSTLSCILSSVSPVYKVSNIPAYLSCICLAMRE